MFVVISLGVMCMLFAFQNCGGRGASGGEFDLSPLSSEKLLALVRPCELSTCLNFYIDESLSTAKGNGLKEAFPTNSLCTAVSNALKLVPVETGIPGFTFQFNRAGDGPIVIACELDFPHGSVIFN